VLVSGPSKAAQIVIQPCPSCMDSISWDIHVSISRGFQVCMYNASLSLFTNSYLWDGRAGSLASFSVIQAKQAMTLLAH